MELIYLLLLNPCTSSFTLFQTGLALSVHVTMLRVSFACALLAASVSPAQATLNGFTTGANKTELTSEADTTRKTDKNELETRRLDGSYAPTSPRHFTFESLPFGASLAQNEPPLLGEAAASLADERYGKEVELQELKKLLGDYVTQQRRSKNVQSVLDLSEAAPAPVMSNKWISNSRSLQTKAPIEKDSGRSRVAHMLRRKHRQDVLPPESSIEQKDTERFNLTRPDAGIVEYDIDNFPDEGNEIQPGVHPDCKVLQKIFSSGFLRSAYKVVDRFHTLDAPAPEVASDTKLLNYGKEVRRQDKDRGQRKPANRSETGARGSKVGNMLHVPVRRLTPLFPSWGTAKQHIDRRTKKDEETFQAFEREVAQLKTGTMKELANVLGTRRRPVDMPLLENVVAKVGLNGLGGPSPIDLSIKERALMDQARRHRQQVEKIKSKYERDTKYLAEELRDWLQWSNKYRQRISNVVNNGMYTSAAQLSV